MTQCKYGLGPDERIHKAQNETECLDQPDRPSVQGGTERKGFGVYTHSGADKEGRMG